MSESALLTLKQYGLDPNLAIKSFFKDPDWVLKTAVGGVWNASSLLLMFFLNIYPVLIPIIFTLWAINTGYILRVMRTRLRDPEGVLPAWNDWQDLFVSGMSWLAIVTGVIIVFLFLGATNLLIASILSAIKQYTQLFALWMSASIIFLLAFSLLTNLVLVATMANFAQEENTMAAFAFFKVLKRILKRPGDFFAAWMLGIGIQALSIIIPACTIIGIFFLPSTIFAGQLIASSLLAQAWASAETAATGSQSGDDLKTPDSADQSASTPAIGDSPTSSGSINTSTKTKQPEKPNSNSTTEGDRADSDLADGSKSDSSTADSGKTDSNNV